MISNEVQKLGRLTLSAFAHRRHITNLAVHFINGCEVDLGMRYPIQELRELIGLNLKFIPTPHPSIKRLLHNFDIFQTRVFYTWKRHTTPRVVFQEERRLGLQQSKVVFPQLLDDELQVTISQLALKTPPVITDWLSATRSRLEQTYNDCMIGYRPHSRNLSKSQRQLLKLLKEQYDYGINGSDKNIGPVTYRRSDYVAECLRQLRETTTYVRIGPLEQHQAAIFSACEKLLDAILRNSPISKSLIAWKLKKHGGRFAQFYITYKLHKIPIVGRPIGANIHWVSANASRFIDAQLQPWVKKHEFVLNNSASLCRWIGEHRERLPQDAILFTADAESLYTNIDMELGLKALNWFMATFTDIPREVQILILQLAEFVLTTNYLEFEGEIYQQIFGTAMGTPFAPVYAIISLLFVENEIFTPDIRALFWMPYKRYIDDCIGVFIGSVEDLKSLVFDKFTELYHRFKWKIITSTSSVDFTDLTVYVAKDGTLQHRLYAKPFNLYLYTPPHSFHTPESLRAWIYAELLRILVNNSTEVYFVASKISFHDHLTARGFSPDYLATSFSKVQWHQRHDVLYQNIKRHRESPIDWKGCIFSTENDPLFHRWSSRFTIDFTSIDGYWSTAANDDPTELAQAFPEKALIARKRAANLGDILSRCPRIPENTLCSYPPSQPDLPE